MEKNFHEKLETTRDLDALEHLRLEFFGKQGVITEQLKGLGKLPPEDRKIEGARINVLKDALQSAWNTKKDTLEKEALIQKLNRERVDVTLPSSVHAGSHHIVSQTIVDIAHYFERLGFTCKDGPDIETEENNFDALNIPAHHPARQSHDTFYIKGMDPLLLRTHTSTIQSRMLKEKSFPLRILAPGRVYRADYDATHLPMFHQVEGFVVEEGVNLRHLKGTLIDFCKFFFETESLEVRFRPSFFPFTEPSFEMDIWRDQGWLEVLGCGMIHPNVFKNAGMDPTTVEGFAFGLGVERFAMLKHGISDLRHFVGGDIRFSKKYGISSAHGM